MNLLNLKSKLQPKKHAFEIEGETIYIHRPFSGDLQFCTNAEMTVILCTCDEAGKRIFTEQENDAELIYIRALEATHVQTIFKAITDLFENTDVQDEVEKK
ncbi:hypothetical protein [Cedecea lapagei]|uniref:hypothetical protein n=1 Tax=Cedecea lapagei TaxID=158823 RepID=UPI001BCFC776|nr:hypothetical protein [Cedecea lapagei]